MLLSTNLWEEMQSYLFMDAKLSPKKDSVASYRSVNNALVKYFSVTPFTRPNFANYQFEQKQRGNKPQTIDNHLKMAKHIDKYLTTIDPERKLILKDYTFIKDKTEFQFFTFDASQVENMIAVTDYNHRGYLKRDKALIGLIAATAARPAEALGLLWTDLKDAGGNYSVMYRDTKNGTDRRVPILREDIWQNIMALPKISKYVFPNDNNSSFLAKQSLGEIVRRRVKACGIKSHLGIEPYTFRRTWLTLAVDSGMSIPDAQKIMGHKDVNTTMKYYNSNDAQIRRAMMMHVFNKEKLSFEKLKKMARESVEKILEGTGYSLTALDIDKLLR